MYKYITEHYFMYMEQIARTKVAINGGSFIVRLPKQICEIMGITKGTMVNVYREGNTIILEKVKEECNANTLSAILK